MANLIHDMLTYYQLEDSTNDWERFYKRALKDAYIRGRAESSTIVFNKESFKSVEEDFERYYEYNHDKNIEE